MTVSAYQATTSSSNFTTAALNNDGTTWIGVKTGTESTTGAPNHAIDNFSTAGISSTGSPYELVYLSFTKAVDLTSVSRTTWSHSSGDADFEVWRWNGSGAPTVGSYSPSSMAGWTLVEADDFATGQTKTLGITGYYSSHWLISTPLSVAAGLGNDAFKLGQVYTAAITCTGGANGSGGCAPSISVPEPASITMVLLGGFAATSVRRRRRA